MRHILLIIISFFFVASFVHGATIYGSVYDLSLNKAKNAVVEIDSTPRQRFVAANGTYLFEIGKGKYRISAYFENGNDEMSAEENLTIVDDGVYVMDLFLYPDIREDELLYDDLVFDIEPPYEGKGDNGLISFNLVIGILIISAGALFLAQKRRILIKETKQDVPDNELENIISILSENDGRMTQKEIRKSLPFSEAKISLMIAELESDGKIKKIKKGRGNIICLRKDGKLHNIQD